jgi:hypothetical protein
MSQANDSLQKEKEDKYQLKIIIKFNTLDEND